MWLALIISVPILFIIGTTYNAIKDQKKLEDGKLKDILEKRRIERENAQKELNDLLNKIQKK